MKYAKNEAKAYARETMRGIWAAALNPFDDRLELDEAGLRRNIRHWIDDLGIQGLFIAGKQGEFWSMSLAERKRNAGRQKRGGGAVVESIDSGGSETSPGLQISDPSATVDDTYFDRHWAFALMRVELP